MTSRPSNDTPRACVVRGPRSSAEKASLESFLAAHPRLAPTWFEARDDEDLAAAIRTGTYTACLFASYEAAMDAAMTGDIGPDEPRFVEIELLLADSNNQPDELKSLRKAFAATSNAAGEQRHRRSVRQTIAGTVLSLLLLAAIAGLFLT
ncbi:MAG TPA: hypothetical protein P5081_09065 [Phycisphaerae bacterium]|nr:hypothetical protein [Phycisphaerae bacterium]